MNKKLFALVLAVVFTASCVGVATAAAQQKAAEKKVAVTSTKAPAASKAPAATRKPNFGMLAGTIAAIDTSDPANVKIQVKNETDGTVRTISVTPWTNITKVTDISELKTGEQVRMMTRKVDDKDVAMGIMFGKVKPIPAPAPKATAAPVTAPAAAKAKK